ncbi:MAG: alpha-ribazole phosphatase [Candidatus Omnitrophota bacterium]
MVKVFLIRHGQTNDNAQKKYSGFSDPPLNEQGIQQSQKLAVRLRGLEIDRVYSSDLKRAYQTARIIFGERPIQQLSGLREMNFGLFEGLTHKEIMKCHPELYRRWIANPQKQSIPQGEPWQEFQRRVAQQLSAIIDENPGKTLAVVTHSGPIRVLLCQALQYDAAMFWQIEQNSAALNIIDYSTGSAPLAVTINDTAHLS